MNEALRPVSAEQPVADERPGPAARLPARTAGLVVIGNEVLSAKVRDENTPLLLERLSRAGVRVLEAVMLRDDIDRIAAVVREFADRFELVVTTGGVGPTHDDCTWKAVAQALGRELVLHQPLIERIEARLGEALTDEQKRMALLPVGTELVGADTRWPMLRVENVYVLPGVPSMVAGRVELLCEMLAQPRPHLATVFLGVEEWHSVPAIDAVVAAFDDLEIGSYPVFDDADHRLRLTFEGPDRTRVEAAVQAIVAALGPENLVRLEWRDTGHAAPAQEPS